MGDLSEILHRGASEHEHALAAGGGARGDLAARSISAAQRRRAWRGGAASAVAVAATVGVVASAVAIGGGGGGQLTPAQRAVEDDPTSLGACSAYMPANPDVMPPGTYLGRAYVDPASDFVVAVTPDGKARRVLPDQDGNYVADFDGRATTVMGAEEFVPYPSIMDFRQGGGGGEGWTDAGLGSYAWTRVDTGPAPAGVDVTSLWATLQITLTGGGTGYDPGAVPDGGTTAFFAAYDDGHEDTGAMVRDHPTPNTEDELDLVGLAAVGLRVSLADGTDWELRFAYAPENIPELPCEPLPPSGIAESGGSAFSTAPSTEGELAPGVSQGPETAWPGGPLGGPESQVFACGEPLPATLEDAAHASARTASGEVALDEGDRFDVGADGLFVELELGAWSVDPRALAALAPAQGWQAYGESHDGADMMGGVRFLEVVALRDGEVVAVAHDDDTDWTSGGVGDISAMYWLDGGSERGRIAYNSISTRMVGCDGATAPDLTGTSLAVLFGSGPAPDEATFGWVEVTDQ